MSIRKGYRSCPEEERSRNEIPIHRWQKMEANLRRRSQPNGHWPKSKRFFEQNISIEVRQVKCYRILDIAVINQLNAEPNRIYETSIELSLFHTLDRLHLRLMIVVKHLHFRDHSVPLGMKSVVNFANTHLTLERRFNIFY